MRYQIIFIGFIYILCVPSLSEAKNKCFNAKTCVHDAKEKCGEEKNGELRRFLDTCDMKEYNCLKGTDYFNVSLDRCQALPPIDEKSSEVKKEEIQEEQNVKTLVDEPEAQDEIKNEK